MPSPTLSQFLHANNALIVARCRDRVGALTPPPATPAELDGGLPAFIDDLADRLSGDESQEAGMQSRARQHGADLFTGAFSIEQVVRDYGAVCQVVTELAVEMRTEIEAADFQTLNQCLDNAIAHAVSEFANMDKEQRGGLEHTMTMRNLTHTAKVAFETIKSGTVASGGATGDLLSRCLATMESLLAESRGKSPRIQ